MLVVSAFQGLPSVPPPTLLVAVLRPMSCLLDVPQERHGSALSLLARQRRLLLNTGLAAADRSGIRMPLRALGPAPLLLLLLLLRADICWLRFSLVERGAPGVSEL